MRYLIIWSDVHMEFMHFTKRAEIMAFIKKYNLNKDDIKAQFV